MGLRKPEKDTNNSRKFSLDEIIQTPLELFYFQETYGECRRSFRTLCELARLRHRGVQVESLHVKSRKDSDLTIDCCYVPARSRYRNLVIMTSGVHGVEAFAGSAVQQMFIKTILPEMDLTETGVLLIHGINPFGFKYLRRVTENNVDLNRNFYTDQGAFEKRKENRRYRMFHSLMNPDRPARLNMVKRALLQGKTLYYGMRYTTKKIRTAMLQGQYDYENGIYFGGKKFEQQKELLEQLLIRYCRMYMNVMEIDLHTGYGTRGTLHLFPSPISDPLSRRAFDRVFLGYELLRDDESYEINGDFTVFIGGLIPIDRIYVPITFEYGTSDTQTIIGSLASSSTLILENQAHHFGSISDGDSEAIKKRFLEMFYPSSEKWRISIIQSTAKILPEIITRFNNLPYNRITGSTRLERFIKWIFLKLRSRFRSSQP